MPFKVLKRRFILVTICISAVFSEVHAQVITPDSIDRLVDRTLKTFDVPGIAVAIVKDDKMIFAKGYGYITEQEHSNLTRECSEIGKMLGAMIHNPSPFLTPDS